MSSTHPSIEQAAKEKHPDPEGGFWTETQKYHVEKLREAFVSGCQYAEGKEDRVIIVWKDGTHKEVDKQSAWEFENDENWLVTISGHVKGKE